MEYSVKKSLINMLNELLSYYKIWIHSYPKYNNNEII